MYSIFRYLLRAFVSIDLSEEDCEKLASMLEEYETLEDVLRTYPEINSEDLTKVFLVFKSWEYCELYYN